jgi:hypothetical protein
MRGLLFLIEIPDLSRRRLCSRAHIGLFLFHRSAHPLEKRSKKQLCIASQPPCIIAKKNIKAKTKLPFGV